MFKASRQRKIKTEANMNIKITYRPGARPIEIKVDTKEKNITDIAKDAAQQLTNIYSQWRSSQGMPMSRKEKIRYAIGQEYMIIEKIKEKASR